MLLAIDVGNTNVVIALFHETELVHEWRINSDPKRTADEYISILLSLFRDAGLSLSAIDSSVMSTVVPQLLGPFIRVVERLSGKKPLVVNASIYDKLPVKVPQTAIHEIGTDLVCNAVEAYFLCKKSCIVVDFGTALTFTALAADGQIEGVAITPGLGTAVTALFSNTAQLPSVPLEAPPSSLGTNTIHSIQAGIVLGYKGLVEALIADMKRDMHNKNGTPESEIHVVATGGLNSVLKPITSVFQHVDKQLTLKGLRRIAEICGEC